MLKRRILWSLGAIVMFAVPITLLIVWMFTPSDPEQAAACRSLRGATLPADSDGATDFLVTAVQCRRGATAALAFRETLAETRDEVLADHGFRDDCADIGPEAQQRAASEAQTMLMKYDECKARHDELVDRALVAAMVLLYTTEMARSDAPSQQDLSASAGR